MDIFEFHAGNAPTRLALTDSQLRLEWAELAPLVRRCAAGLRSIGVSPNDHCAIFASNSAKYVIATSAIRAAGGVSVPINSHLAAPEVQHILEDSGAKVLFVDTPRAKVAAEASRASSAEHIITLDHDGDHLALDDLAQQDPASLSDSGDAFGTYILYTSGTTGVPKGAVHLAGPGADVGAAYADAFGLRWEDVHLVAGPLYHSAPQAFCAITLTTGGSVVVMESFAADRAAHLIAEESVTTTFMAPILLKRLCDHLDSIPRRERPDLSSLRAVIVAGAHCPHALKVRAMELLGPVLYEFYGSTETKAALVIGPEDQLRKPGSCGKPFPGVEVKLVDEVGQEPPVGEPGVIWVRRNAASFDHYHRDETKTATTVRGDWIVTGDIAYIDEEGFYYICDRVTDVVISGGVNIYPAEVERALMEHPSVEDVAVVGVPDDKWGERLHALVVLTKSDTTPEDLQTFLRGRIAGFKVPRSWQMVESLPRSEDGKLRKGLLELPSDASR